MKILLIDSYDSFTYNLADYLFRTSAEVDIIRNDQFSPNELDLGDYSGVLLSPGPSIPEKAGMLMPFIETFAGEIPILGVCLGFQALGIFYGARLIKGKEPVHGKSAEITCLPHPMYANIPLRHRVGRYHSLCLENLPPCLKLTAQTTDGVPMAFAHESFPVWGVQYHPEAIYTEFGHQFIRNWVNSLKS